MRFWNFLQFFYDNVLGNICLWLFYDSALENICLWLFYNSALGNILKKGVFVIMCALCKARKEGVYEEIY